MPCEGAHKLEIVIGHFFHSLLQSRKPQHAISSLNIDRVFITNRHAIKNHIISYYMNLFAEDDFMLTTDLSIVDEIIPSSVSLEDNYMLIAILSSQKAKNVIFSLDPSSIPSEILFLLCCLVLQNTFLVDFPYLWWLQGIFSPSHLLGEVLLPRIVYMPMMFFYFARALMLILRR